MILTILLIALAGLTIWVASRHQWNVPATLAALGALVAAVWSALWNTLSGGGTTP